MGITAPNIQVDHPNRLIALHRSVDAASATGAVTFDLRHWMTKVAGTIVDVVVTQSAAGTISAGAPSFTADVKRRRAGGAAASVLATTAGFTQAAGAGVAVDAKKDVAAVTGGTRPALLASGNAGLRLQKGDTLEILYTPTTGANAYTVGPSFCVTVVVDPDQRAVGQP